MFGGLTHEPAIRLAERLTDWTGLDHVFFADSGSVSVEVAIKLVLQSWHGERTKLLTWRGGYHGDTFGAMAVCDPDGGHAQHVARRARRARLRAAAALGRRSGKQTVRDAVRHSTSSPA